MTTTAMIRRFEARLRELPAERTVTPVPADRIVEVVRYTYRLRPGVQAERALIAEWHRCRFLWNEAVHLQHRRFWPDQKRASKAFAQLSKMLTAARKANTWLREGSQVAQQQMLRTYGRALNHSFKVKGRRRPVYKHRKKALPSMEYTTNGFSIRDGRLVLPRGVTIPVVWSRDLPSAPTSVNVYRDNLGHWYASFVVRRETEVLPDIDAAIGIDWGISTIANTTEASYDLQYAGYNKRCAAQVAKAQRKMARRRRVGKTQSNRYRDAKREAARLAKKAARQTQYDSRVWAKRVADNHGTIAIENPDIRSWTNKKRTNIDPEMRKIIASKAHDAAIGATRRELIERGRRAGRRVVLVQPAFTTMTCSECFARNKRLDLGVRTFRCVHCGYSAGRDWNAARLILTVAERGHTSVDDCVLPSGRIAV